MAYDANSVLQTLVTKTATFQSASLDLRTGTPRRGQVARVIVSAYNSVSTAGAVFTFSVEESTDNTAFTTLGVAPPITAATAAAQKELFIPFSMTPGARYCRLVETLTTSSGVPSISYLADLGIARP